MELPLMSSRAASHAKTLALQESKAGLDEGSEAACGPKSSDLLASYDPQYVIVENVANLLSGPSEKRGGWFGRVLGDLAECGYDAEWENISRKNPRKPDLQ
jgi:DNA (cytosine-5)-methyltransferase 1